MYNFYLVIVKDIKGQTYVKVILRILKQKEYIKGQTYVKVILRRLKQDEDSIIFNV